MIPGAICVPFLRFSIECLKRIWGYATARDMGNLTGFWVQSLKKGTVGIELSNAHDRSRPLPVCNEICHGQLTSSTIRDYTSINLNDTRCGTDFNPNDTGRGHSGWISAIT